ncbi:tripartite tricarboxylate transporter TctB family protein [Jiangella asiatica]|uniref:Tripartite tricarboxylate transporter TctB family protein n=1 Tax=Jiangella asiatica TaxID=2530372 RepID=A0A4R5CUL6_9ACTN|nr:tripartite tricarboxylate transporter TctB family protein [Jiangella asiatica]TDE03120.1 tripartite tricarboxylate transporter TctB family protein [Jiangella asiatica]
MTEQETTTLAADEDAPVAVGRPVRHARRVMAVLMILLGLYLVREGQDVGYSTENEPGPGLFPVWVGALLAVLSLGWLIAELRRPADAAPPRLDPHGPPRVLALLGAMALLAATFEPLGYNLSVLLFFLLLSFTIGGRDHAVVKVVVAVVLSFGVYLAFEYGLGITLPGSIIPFLYSWGL